MDPVKKSLSKLAREMLNLEKKQFSQKLSDEESERWAELAFALFEKNETTKRRSFRLPVEITAEVEFEAKRQEVKIAEVSLIGVSLVGKIFENVAPGVSISLYIKLAGLNSGNPVCFKCSVANVRAEVAPAQQSVGLLLQSGASEKERQDYYNLVYFPAYLGYLESLANE